MKKKSILVICMLAGLLLITSGFLGHNSNAQTAVKTSPQKQVKTSLQKQRVAATVENQLESLYIWASKKDKNYVRKISILGNSIDKNGVVSYMKGHLKPRPGQACLVGHVNRTYSDRTFDFPDIVGPGSYFKRGTKGHPFDPKNKDNPLFTFGYQNNTLAIDYRKKRGYVIYPQIKPEKGLFFHGRATSGDKAYYSFQLTKILEKIVQ